MGVFNVRRCKTLHWCAFFLFGVVDACLVFYIFADGCNRQIFVTFPFHYFIAYDLWMATFSIFYKKNIHLSFIFCLYFIFSTFSILKNFLFILDFSIFYSSIYENLIFDGTFDIYIIDEMESGAFAIPSWSKLY